MGNKELQEIALKYVDNSYDYEQLMWGDDLYNATAKEKRRCAEYFEECRDSGMIEFREKYNI